MRRISALAPLALAVLSLASPGAARADGELRSGAKRVCLSAGETRDEIKARHLHEPFAALKHAATVFKAEALSAKLCRIDDEFIYEIALLHHDGKFVHAHINATSGKIVEYKRAAPAPTKNEPKN